MAYLPFLAALRISNARVIVTPADALDRDR